MKGSNWKHVEGFTEGQTATCTNRFGNTYCAFGHPIDVHLACRGVQGWPKIHLEVYAVNVVNFKFILITNRYKLSTISAGKVTVELMIIAKNFSTFGVSLK